MAFLPTSTKTLLGLFILILCGFPGVFSKLKEPSYEKYLCQKYPRDYGPCSRNYDPICGKDDVTYINLCFFCWTFWNEYQGRVHFRKFGRCSQRET
ncbi:ovomucoid-like [Vombatus ursinus]|uniref:ovomucoid-like n=1 Tax=Vombatus ursinus TaxID=29139 RepID=UPI000FFDBC1F|nr:ovomucoid-like [Vombatus ursinus]